MIVVGCDDRYFDPVDPVPKLDQGATEAHAAWLYDGKKQRGPG